MKHRILIFVLVLALSLLCSCKKHTHEFSGDYLSDKTGHWQKCECGDKGETAEHVWNEGETVIFPTEEMEGVKVFTCTVCGFEKNEQIDKLEEGHTHTFDTIQKNEGSHWYVCVCGETHGNELHTWNEGVVTIQPTLESEGVKTFTCTVCKHERTEKIERLYPDHDHNYVISASDEYSHWMQCECGKKENIAPHVWDNGAVTTPAGDITVGIKTFICTGCGHKYTEILPANRANGLSFLQSTHYRISNKLEKTPLTIEAEICVDPSVTGRAGVIFGNYYGIRQDWLFEIYENGVPRFYYTDSTGNVKDYKFNNVDVRTGEFVHIALTFDYAKREITLYLDGEIAQTIVCGNDLASDITRYQFVLGGDNRSNNGVYFKGQIRSVAAYSDVRTAEEISASAQKGTNLYADDLLVSYLLNENSAGKEIKDLSGNGYDIPVEWLDSHETQLDYAYSFAVVGDTQWLSKYATAKMEGIYDWIIANKDSKKIAHVFGLGDITEDWNTAGKEAEWITAQQYISKLDGVIPYSLIRGNHDESKYFNKYFANETYMSQFDGFMVEGDIRNSYKEFTVGSTDYLFITLDYGASDEMLEWANEVVLAHPGHRVIVTTHGYQGFDGGHLTSNNTPSSGNITAGSDVDTSVGDNGNRGYNNGAQIWEKFVSRHPNIFLVMSGHTPDEDILLLQSEGNHGNIVNQMLIDPQWMDPQKGGVGMVCMLYFSADGTQMEVEWISTDTGKYYKEMNQFTLDLTDSLNAPAHEFHDSYNETCHYVACDCGYTYNEQPHVFDGGTLNADGLMVYSCDCGYERITSATDDPIAKELQKLFEKYYNNGVYYKDSYFFKSDKFMSDDGAWESVADMLTLHDFVMGKYGSLRLDLGWNYYEGVYSSVNSDTVEGARILLGGASGVDKVTVEESDNRLIIKLWTDDSLACKSEIGYYVTTSLVILDDNTLDEIYTKMGSNGICEILLHDAIEGYVPEYDRIIVSLYHDELYNTVYCSSISTWDGSSVSSSLSGSGTEADPYLIQSAADFAYLQNGGFGGIYFKLTTSIDLDNKAFTIDSFNGVLDGNHCSIRGINITNTADNTGLFKVLEIDSYVYDLSLYGTVSGAKYTGALAGILKGKINNVVNYATVSGAGNLGGVVGNSKNESLVENCKNYGNVNGSSWNNGGVVGFAQNKVTGCINYGNVATTGDCAGGVVGTAHALVYGCINYGSVSGKGRCGGVAYNSTSTIDHCINYGTVYGLDPTNSWDLGGILSYVGEGKSATITNCINNGKIQGTTGIGGIFGFSHASAASVTITNCVNNGEVITNWGGGGIAGSTKADISNCVNNGIVTGVGQIGGIVGKCYGNVTECTNNGIVEGTDSKIGGIVGELYVITYLKTINETNYQNGTVSGPNSKDVIGYCGVEITLNENVIGINHRGWYEAPENTLSAYRESYNHGFKYVECDVLFTKDGIPVLLHDDTIDRTSNGSGSVSSLTYAELLQYDFSYDDNDTSIDFSAYRGEKIPTFNEFIALCKELGLHAYVEIKNTITDAQAQQLVKIVTDAGMLDNVSWLSFSGDALAKIASLSPTSRIVWVITNTDATKLGENNVPFAKENLMTGQNKVVFDLWYSLAKQDVVDLLNDNNIALEVWTVNDANIMLTLHPYVTGVTSDKLDASVIVKEN